MQGMILAAGMGTRLKHLTRDNTKCMVKVNGVPLIDRMLKQLDKYGLSRIIIVIGYQKQNLLNHIQNLQIKTPLIFIENPIFSKTNNIYSLYLAKDFLLEDDTLLLESDLIFEDSVLETILNDPRDTLALVDKYESWMDGTCVKLGDDDSIEAFIPGDKFIFEDIPKYFKTVNIYKFSRSFSEKYYVPFLDAYSRALGCNEYYEQVLRVITLLDIPVIQAKRLVRQKWYEIDDLQDLDIASSIFVPDKEERVSQIVSRYGGYWRYPHLKDFCYLVNPYYPPKKMLDEIKANIGELITNYPSGARVNTLLIAKNFNINPDYILAGNGAAELIKLLMGNLSGNVGIIKPTFEEYPQCCHANIVTYVPLSHFPFYSTDDIISFFTNKQINSLILVNPDNPTGNYILRADVIRLLEWCNEKNILFILDESFIDFADEDGSILNNEILNKYYNLIIVKSISKAYGVPGLRLGLLACANQAFLKKLKNDMPIWNINSVAEFYLQIAEKYKKDYLSALISFKNSRELFFSSLSRLNFLNVFPSQANYFLIELINGLKAKQITSDLLQEGILVKDLTNKIRINNRQFLRIAVRSIEDNIIFIKKLSNLIENNYFRS